MTCPFCNRPFKVITDGVGYFAYCAYGPCDNQIANNGAFGATPESAAFLLSKILDRLAVPDDGAVSPSQGVGSPCNNPPSGHGGAD